MSAIFIGQHTALMQCARCRAGAVRRRAANCRCGNVGQRRAACERRRYNQCVQLHGIVRCRALCERYLTGVPIVSSMFKGHS